MGIAAAQQTARSRNEIKQEQGRLCVPDCLSGFQSEEGACLLAGDVALGLPLPHHQGLQLQVMHRQQSGLGTQLTLLHTLTHCDGLCYNCGWSTQLTLLDTLTDYVGLWSESVA